MSTKGRATIEQVENGWVVERDHGSGQYTSVFTDYVAAIKAVASCVGYSTEIVITSSPSASGES